DCLYAKDFFEHGVKFALVKPSGDDLKFPSDVRLHPYMGTAEDLVQRNKDALHGKLKLYGEMAECHCLGHGIGSPALNNPAEEALIFIVKLAVGSHAGNSSPYSKIPFFPRPAKNAELDILRTMRAKLFVSAYNSPPFLALNSGADCSAVRNPGQPHEGYLSRSFATNNELMGHQPPLALNEYPKIPCPQLPTAHISIADQKAAKRDFFAKLEPYPDVLGLLFFGDRPTEIVSIVSAPGWGNETWMGKPRFATVTLDELRSRSFFAAAFLDTAIVGYAQGAARVLALGYFFELDRCTIELTDYILRMRKLFGVQEVLNKARTMWDESLGPRMLQRAEALRPVWNVPKGGGAELHQGLSADESVAPNGLPDYKVDLSSLRPDFEATFADWKQYHGCDANVAVDQSSLRIDDEADEDLSNAERLDREASLRAAELLTDLTFSDAEVVRKAVLVQSTGIARAAKEKAADRAERSSRTELRHMAFQTVEDYDNLPEAEQEAVLGRMKATRGMERLRRLEVGIVKFAAELGLLPEKLPDLAKLDEPTLRKLIDIATMKLNRYRQLKPYSDFAILAHCLVCRKDYCKEFRRNVEDSEENEKTPHPKAGGCTAKKLTMGWTALPSYPGIESLEPLINVFIAFMDAEALKRPDRILVINLAQVATSFAMLVRDYEAQGHAQAVYLADKYKLIMEFYVKQQSLVDWLGDSDEAVAQKKALKNGFIEGLKEGLDRAGRCAVASRVPQPLESDSKSLSIYAFGSLKTQRSAAQYEELEDRTYLNYAAVVNARKMTDNAVSKKRGERRKAGNQAIDRFLVKK
ncbi:hypothetical protein DFJ74DRAFT_662436, partial [Hyaloraphidium curvatum]